MQPADERAATGPGPPNRVATVRPSPRADGLRQVRRGLRLLVTGRRPAPARPPDPLIVAAREADAALAAGDGMGALTAAERILAGRPRDADALDRKRRALALLDDLPGLLLVTARLRRLRDAPGLAELARRTAGRIAIGDPRWAPRLPGLREAAPLAAGRTLHLVMPERGTSGAELAAQALAAAAAERAAGGEAEIAMLSLGPAGAMAPPGAPAAETVAADAGGADATAPGAAAAVPAIPEAGLPAYPADAPPDVAVRDWTWLAVRCAAASGADRVVVHGDPGPGALAEIARLLARPVVAAARPAP